MKRLWPWILTGLTIAVAGHLLLVISTPWIVNTLWFVRLHNLGIAKNEMGHMKRPKTAGRDIVGYDNPDNLSSFVWYDVTRAPLRLRFRVVRDAAYWSVCFVDDQANVFNLVRDKDVAGDNLVVVLARRGQQVSPLTGEKVVFAATDTGIVLVRLIMPDRNDAEAVARLVAENADASLEVLPPP